MTHRHLHGDGSAEGGDHLHRVVDIAERARLSVREIRRLIANGELIAHRFGRAVRVAEADYRRFLARHRRPRP